MYKAPSHLGLRCHEGLGQASLPTATQPALGLHKGRERGSGKLRTTPDLALLATADGSQTLPPRAGNKQEGHSLCSGHPEGTLLPWVVPALHVETQTKSSQGVCQVPPQVCHLPGLSVEQSAIPAEDISAPRTQHPTVSPFVGPLPSPCEYLSSWKVCSLQPDDPTSGIGRPLSAMSAQRPEHVATLQHPPASAIGATLKPCKWGTHLTSTQTHVSACSQGLITTNL